MSLELSNNRVYSARDIEKWLTDCVGVRRGTKRWKKALNDASETVLGEDTYFFERVSETHYRVHRANAEEVKQIHTILDEAVGVKKMYRNVRIGYFLWAFMLLILVVTAVVTNLG